MFHLASKHCSHSTSTTCHGQNGGGGCVDDGVHAECTGQGGLSRGPRAGTVAEVGGGLAEVSALVELSVLVELRSVGGLRGGTVVKVGGGPAELSVLVEARLAGWPRVSSLRGDFGGHSWHRL